MRPRGGGRGEHLLAVLARLYGALLVLYPEAFRRRYEAEMRRDFRELMREVLEEGGAKELVRVWAQAHTDLVLTALKERSTTSASRYAAYLSVDPRIAKKAAARAVVVTVFVAVAVVMASLWQTPTYESSAQVWVDWQQGDQQTYVTRSGEEIQTLPPKGLEELQAVTQVMAHAVDSRPVAEESIERLGLQMDPSELLDNLTVEQVESTSFIVLSYEDTDPVRAKYIANTIGEVSSQLISERSAAGSNITATLYDKAIISSSAASPHPWRNGLLTLMIGLGLCVGVVVALPGVGASVARKLGRPIVLQGVGQAGLPSGRHGGPSQAYVIKDYVIKVKELLEALGRCGKLTAVEAALESSLSVAAAERMLQDLEVKGHLEVSFEHGRLHYALLERGAPYEGL